MDLVLLYSDDDDDDEDDDEKCMVQFNSVNTNSIHMDFCK
jgi:hypothetical protein